MWPVVVARQSIGGGKLNAVITEELTSLGKTHQTCIGRNPLCYVAQRQGRKALIAEQQEEEEEEEK